MHLFDKVVDQEQAESGSIDLAIVFVVDAVESLENVLEFVRFNTDPAVPHVQQKLFALAAFAADGDVAPTSPSFGHVVGVREAIELAVRNHPKVGEAKAKELMFMSPRLSARDALSMNIVNAVLPDENYEEAALSWCHELASRAPVALQYIKQNINRSLEVPLETALDAEAVAMVRTMGTADHREASAAFVEKRPANFTGS